MTARHDNRQWPYRLGHPKDPFGQAGSASSLPLGTVLPTAKAARADPSITLGVYAHVISDQLTEAVRGACQAYAVVQDLLHDA